MRRVVRVSVEGGISWVTEINGTEQEVIEYFLGSHFDVGGWRAGEHVEDLRECIKVEFLK